LRIGIRTYFLKTIFKKTEIESKIKILKPIGFSEKMSQKNPAETAEKMAKFLLGSSKRVIKI
jgi:hypothetical protein